MQPNFISSAMIPPHIVSSILPPVLVWFSVDVFMIAGAHLSNDEFFNGQLVLSGKDLRERVFDPVVDNVRFLDEILFGTIPMLRHLSGPWCAGGPITESRVGRRAPSCWWIFCKSISQRPRMGTGVPVIKQSLHIHGKLCYMQDAFHERLRDTIRTPIDPDIATSLGSAQSGLAENLIQRPIGAPTIIASKSYAIGVGANHATRSKGNKNSRNAPAAPEVFEYESDIEMRTLCIISLMDFAFFSGRSIYWSRAHC